LKVGNGGGAGFDRIRLPNTNPKKEPTAVKKPYQIVTRAAKESAAVVEQFCQSNGQILLPIVNLIESASQVVENVIHEIQVHALETIFVLSAEQIAGRRTPGKPSGEIRWHGSQPGKIKLADREVKVKRPRLRHKSEGEVKIPAYEKLRRDRGLQQHMLGTLMRGVSTREYDEVLPKMAETVGVSRSSVSRQAIEASAEQLKRLREKRWEAVEILVIYIDGQRFGAHHILSAVGVDREGRKHILGIEVGATENALRSSACSFICAIRACRPIAPICSSSTVRKPCARPSTKFSAQRSTCSAAAITNSATCSTNCRRRSKARP